MVLIKDINNEIRDFPSSNLDVIDEYFLLPKAFSDYDFDNLIEYINFYDYISDNIHLANGLYKFIKQELPLDLLNSNLQQVINNVKEMKSGELENEIYKFLVEDQPDKYKLETFINKSNFPMVKYMFDINTTFDFIYLMNIFLSILEFGMNHMDYFKSLNFSWNYLPAQFKFLVSILGVDKLTIDDFYYLSAIIKDNFELLRYLKNQGYVVNRIIKNYVVLLLDFKSIKPLREENIIDDQMIINAFNLKDQNIDSFLENDTFSSSHIELGFCKRAFKKDLTWLNDEIKTKIKNGIRGTLELLYLPEEAEKLIDSLDKLIETLAKNDYLI